MNIIVEDGVLRTTFKDDEQVYHTMGVEHRCLIVYANSKGMSGLSSVIHVFNAEQWTRAYNEDPQ